jgi:hypothetical protein
MVIALVACGGTGAEEGSDAGMESSEMAQSALVCSPQADVEDRASPYDSTTVAVGDGMAKVCYSRPSLRGRTMIGGEAVPYGQVWRTGANEPTTIHLNTAATIAGIEVEAGSYSLYTIPREAESWTLIVNASTSQWGHESSYPGVEEQDVGRAEVETESLAEPVEQFTIRPMNGGLVVEWQNARVHIPIEPA